jgi:hypothetical protein
MIILHPQCNTPTAIRVIEQETGLRAMPRGRVVVMTAPEPKPRTEPDRPWWDEYDFSKYRSET